MNDIKFRQYIEKDNHWHYWGTFDEGMRTVSAIEGIKSEQYTGRKDKNGREVYEGDVVRDGNTTEYVRRVETADFAIGSTSMDSIDMNDWEVVGNITQHPHLIV